MGLTTERAGVTEVKPRKATELIKDCAIALKSLALSSFIIKHFSMTKIAKL